MTGHSPIHILLAIGHYDSRRGGAEEWVRHYAYWLATRGHTVTLLCQSADGPPPPGCRLVTLPIDQRSRNSRRRAAALQNLAAAQGADLIHDTGCLLASDVFHPLMGSLIHNWQRQLRAFPLGMRLRRLANVRLWRDVRLQYHQNRHHRVLIAASRRAADDFASFGCRATEIILNGIAPLHPRNPEIIARIRRETASENRILVLLTATNFYLKGVPSALAALTRLTPAERERIQLVVTGHNLPATFEGYRRRHQLKNCCRHLGWVEVIDDYYHAADVYLHPTYHDACSLSTLKGLASDCAVVTTRFDGAAEFITPGQSGLVLQQPADIAELAAALRQLMDPALRQKLRAGARLLGNRLEQERQFRELELMYQQYFQSTR